MPPSRRKAIGMPKAQKSKVSIAPTDEAIGDDAAEAAVPGGLEGGPGDIRPHDVFAILEKQARKHGPN